ncbi:MAG TPA: type VI secretion system baseplate subunit TssG [Thermoanaerobaculia bacterium]|nr:type VI secretion system baseplate subunit TssG [Thermoanaerobaculia bacterium]
MAADAGLASGVVDEEPRAKGERPSVREELFGDASRFSFLQAVRLLEQMYVHEARNRPAEGVSPQQELVLFRQALRLDFPITDVEHFTERIAPDEPHQMTVNVMGLGGSTGPLPHHVTEQLLARSTRGDRAGRDFLDVFNHRLISLLYRARKKYRPQVDPRGPAHSRVANVLFALLGLGTRHLRGRLGIPDRALLAYAGYFVTSHRPAVGLERIVEHCFDVPAKIKPFVGKWQKIEEDDRTHIGLTGRNQRLGRDTVLGSRYFDQAASFELQLGPMSPMKLVTFLRGGQAFRPLVSLVRFYAREELDFSFRLIVRKKDISKSELTRPRRHRLGWTAWLKTRESDGNDGSVDTQVTLAGWR